MVATIPPNYFFSSCTKLARDDQGSSRISKSSACVIMARENCGYKVALVDFIGFTTRWRLTVGGRAGNVDGEQTRDTQ